MKKLKLSFGKEMTKEQMKKITGGYNCQTGPTVYVCSMIGAPTSQGCVYCYDDCMDGNGAQACANAGFGTYLFVACESTTWECRYSPY